MQLDAKLTPDYIFETSWEVCNKVGGIYTVLSTRANTLQKLYKDRIFFIGPDLWEQEESPWFVEDTGLFPAWRDYSRNKLGLEIRAGRWDVPGTPIVFLVKHQPFFPKQNELYSMMWRDFGVDSLDAYGDYHESTIFAYSTGLLIESFYRFHHLETENVVAHFNEWMMGAGALYIKKNVPKIATIFTTHATSIGRSIAGNNLPLYSNLHEYNGDQMARQLNMTAKHSIEKQTALNVDCFTTVSDITARECAQFLHRQPDVITPNGFEKNFIPTGKEYTLAREKARAALLRVAEKTLGYPVERDALLVGTSGRYEYKNKGIDVFIDALKHLQTMPELNKDVIAFIMVPAWINGPREDLQAVLSGQQKGSDNPSPSKDTRFVTHQLVEPHRDAVVNHVKHQGISNSQNSRVKIVFVPSYLNGDDGIFNLLYYDLLIGFDLSVFPSYYEPWGYTPHESVAFSIPTITTTLAGFGTWAAKQGKKKENLEQGVEVIHRDDNNYTQVAEEIASVIYDFSIMSGQQVTLLKRAAAELSDKADWAHFITHYQEAYRKALHNSFTRLSRPYTLKNQ